MWQSGDCRQSVPSLAGPIQPQSVNHGNLNVYAHPLVVRSGYVQFVAAAAANRGSPQVRRRVSSRFWMAAPVQDGPTADVAADVLAERQLLDRASAAWHVPLTLNCALFDRNFVAITEDVVDDRLRESHLGFLVIPEWFEPQAGLIFRRAPAARLWCACKKSPA
jgi:hypothetical protein